MNKIVFFFFNMDILEFQLALRFQAVRKKKGCTCWVEGADKKRTNLNVFVFQFREIYIYIYIYIRLKKHA